jgi:hypothetical protein
MNDTYTSKEDLTISLGEALKETYDDLRRMKLRTFDQERDCVFLNMKNQTLDEENHVLRERLISAQESLSEQKIKQQSLIKDFQQNHKLENLRMAKVLKRTLSAFKRSKNSLDKLQNEYEILQSQHHAYEKNIQDLKTSLEESRNISKQLAKERFELLQKLKTFNETVKKENEEVNIASKNDLKETQELQNSLKLAKAALKEKDQNEIFLNEKALKLQESLNAFKEKAKQAILIKDDEAKTQRAQKEHLQNYLKAKEEHILKLEQNDILIRQKLSESLKKIQESIEEKTIILDENTMLKEKLLIQEKNLNLLKDDHLQLSQKTKELEQLCQTHLSSLDQKKDEIKSLLQIKSQWQQMQAVFNDIKACVGTPINEEKLNHETNTDLFSFNNKKNMHLQEDLF